MANRFDVNGLAERPEVTAISLTTTTFESSHPNIPSGLEGTFNYTEIVQERMATLES